MRRKTQVHYRIIVSGAIVQKRRILLIKRSAADRTLAGFWEMPGGRREHGETSRQACGREVREEAGLAVDVGEAVDVFEYVIRNPGGVFDCTNIIFRCVLKKPNQTVKISFEHEQFGWFSSAQVRKLKPMTPETRRAISLALG